MCSPCTMRMDHVCLLRGSPVLCTVTGLGSMASKRWCYTFVTMTCKIFYYFRLVKVSSKINYSSKNNSTNISWYNQRNLMAWQSTICTPWNWHLYPPLNSSRKTSCLYYSFPRGPLLSAFRPTSLTPSPSTLTHCVHTVFPTKLLVTRLV